MRRQQTPARRTVRPKAPARGRANTVKAKPLILVVDDYGDAREMYAEYLEFEGFRVQQAGNGSEALDCAMKHPPDVILMDLSLPIMDGWEATRRLKATERTRNIPVIALTGHALAGAADTAAAAGCDAFVTKPCLPEDLVQEIRKALKWRPRIKARS